MFFFNSNHSKVTESMIIETETPIIKKNELVIEKKKIITKTGSGIFYKGTYKNNPVSIKSIDITKNDLLIRELIYWNAFKNNDKVLKIYGVYLTKKFGFIVLEDFVFTMEDAIKSNQIDSIKVKIGLVKQIFEILFLFHDDNKRLLDFRPKIIGISKNGILKLLDFGKLTNSENLIYFKEIEKDKIKYDPPETISNPTYDDLSHDIWSFGCMLIDIFSENNKVVNYNITNIENFKNLVVNGNFPNYSNEKFNPILMNIIRKCLNINIEKRIKYKELESEIKSFIDYYLSDHIDITKINIDDNKLISEKLTPYHFFVTNNEPKIDFKYNDINNNLIEKNLSFQTLINDIYEQENKEFNNNLEIISNALREEAELKRKIILKIKEELLKEIIEIKKVLINAIGDINKSKEILLDMKKNIMYLFSSHYFLDDSEDLVIIKLEQEKKEIMNLLIKYSKEELFDRITLHFDKAKKLVDYYKDLCTQKETLMSDILEIVNNHKKNYIENNELKILLPKLGINLREFNDKDLIENAKDYYKDFICKPYENTNVINVFDLFNKLYYQYTINSIYVYPKNFSYYNEIKRKLYITGGFDDEEKKGVNLVYQISFENYNKFDNNVNELDIDIKELEKMKFSHFSHSTILYKDNFLIVAGGDKIECEIYDIENNIWSLFPQLPFICNNSILCIYHQILFLFNDDKILKLVIKPFQINEKKEILLNSTWDKVDFKFKNQEENKKYFFRNKMGSYCDINNGIIFLFGANDNENKWNYKMNLIDIVEVPDEKNKKNKKIQKILKHKFIVEIINEENVLFNTYFNSNIISFQNNYLIMLDNKNNAIEYNLINNEYFIYDK